MRLVTSMNKTNPNYDKDGIMNDSAVIQAAKKARKSAPTRPPIIICETPKSDDATRERSPPLSCDDSDLRRQERLKRAKQKQLEFEKMKQQKPEAEASSNPKTSSSSSSAPNPASISSEDKKNDPPKSTNDDKQVEDFLTEDNDDFWNHLSQFDNPKDSRSVPHQRSNDNTPGKRVTRNASHGNGRSSPKFSVGLKRKNTA